MPYSYEYFKKEFFEHLTNRFDQDLLILDAGAGCGTYGKLLSPSFDTIDACEIFEPYIDEFNLKGIYRNVFNENILNFNYKDYDYIIFGDIIEHLSVEDAQKILTDISREHIHCMVAIPYTMEQGEVGGNVYETHLQPDLTHEIFLDRYINMRLLFKNEYYGLYVNYP